MPLNIRLKDLLRTLTCSHAPNNSLHTSHTGIIGDSSSSLAGAPFGARRDPRTETLPYTNHRKFNHTFVSTCLKSAANTQPLDLRGRSRFRSPPTAWTDIFYARALLRRLLPLELVDIILQYAEYYYAVVAYTRYPVHSSALELPVLAVSLRGIQARNVVSISLMIKGNDCSPLYGSTWYSIGTEDPDSHDTPIAHNPPSSSALITHQFRWEAQSSVVQQLKEDGVIEVWAHTSLCVLYYPQWHSPPTNLFATATLKTTSNSQRSKFYAFPYRFSLQS